MRSEISADSSSPYRKSALRREFVRVEDAKIRLDEYKKYLNYEKRQIERLWKIERFDLLLEKEAADALLPTEWLYKGKLVVIKLDEIDNENLSKFNHTLSFSESEKEIQQALAIKYGDEFPVLITRYQQNENEKHKRIFYGCVARGIAYLEHIIPTRPAEMIIEGCGSKNKAYYGSLFDGLIKANLPESKLQNTNLRCITGQTAQVYFENYNLTLSANPASQKNEKGHHPQITVSTIEPAQLGNIGEYQIFLAVNETLLNPISDEQFYSADAQWTLLDFNMETGELDLGKATVFIECKTTQQGDGLIVTKIHQTATPQLGVDIPFELLLIADTLEPESIFFWKYGVEQFLQFAIQVAFNQEMSEQRVKQAKFFRRWQAILDYQKQYESQRSIEFESALAPIDKNSFKLTVPYFTCTSTDDDKEWNKKLFEKIRKNELQLQKCCQLQTWDYDKQRYVPVFDTKKKSFYLTETNDFESEGDFRGVKEKSESHLFKFTVTLPNVPLQRQQQALDAFFEDRLVELRLKDILLMPSAYQSEKNNFWDNHNIQWKNANLTSNQKEVVETALKAKHITLIQGPPGTGKTTTIVEMLSQLLSQNPHQRILVVSQQNTAVDNAITRFKDRNPELVENSVNIMRIGNPDKIDEQLSEHHPDELYDEFLKETINRVNCSIHKLPENLQNLSFQWTSLLRQMQEENLQARKTTSDEFLSTMLADKNLIGATCVGLAARKAGIDHLNFDIVIIDEAGRATVPELLIPLLRCKKVVLIGDHFQLPPSIAPILREDSTKEDLPFIHEEFLEKSFFELLFEELPESCKTILKEQFRMPPKIGDLIADLFYTKNGQRQLFNGSDNFKLILPEPIYWVNVKGKHQSPKNSTSLENEAEAQAICDFLKKLSTNNDQLIEVAVITPYGSQKRKIKKLLGLNGQKSKLGNLAIKVDTVDGFQGSEADIVCYSTVRTHGSLQFLLDRKRLNVACSRAKKNLVFFGHSEYLKKWRPNENERNLFSEIIEKYSKLENLFSLLGLFKTDISKSRANHD